MYNPNLKVKTLAQLKRIVKRTRAKGNKVVLAHGIFDFIHYGHIYYLDQAKKLGDVLIVSVVADRFVEKGDGRPVFNEKTRAVFLACLESIDYVVFCEDFGPWGIISEIKPEIYAKGEDSIPQLKDPDSGLNKDKRLVESVGGTLCFTKSLPIHSSEVLRGRKVESFLDSFKKRRLKPIIIFEEEEIEKAKF